MKRIAVALVLPALILCVGAAFHLWAVLIGSIGSVFAVGDAFVTVGGVIYDELRSPIAGATVMLYSAPSFGLHDEATSSADGRFYVGLNFAGGDARRVSEAGFTLRVEKKGFIPVERRNVRDGELTIVLIRKAQIPRVLEQVPEAAPHAIPR
jgi:hypothetical protein